MKGNCRLAWCVAKCDRLPGAAMKLNIDAANRGCTVSAADDRTPRVIAFNPDGGADAESTNRQVERAAVLSTQCTPWSVEISYNTQETDDRVTFAYMILRYLTLQLPCRLM